VISKKATSSPPSETLIATDIGIGIATLGIVFETAIRVITGINSVKENIKESINENTNRLIEVIRETGKKGSKK